VTTSLKRGNLNIDVQHCICYFGSDETMTHLFFACDLTHKIWYGVLQWLEIQSVLHNNHVVHAHHFSGLHVVF
jgi:hypothetical protein